MRLPPFSVLVRLLNTVVFLVMLAPNVNAAITNEREFNSFTTYYYRQPNTENVIPALEYFLHSDLFKNGVETNGHVVEMVAYFFGRLAELTPTLLAEYRTCFEQTDVVGKHFLLSVFRVYHDQATEVFLQRQIYRSTSEAKAIIQKILDVDPLSRKAFVKDVTDFNQLDFLWMEFFATGDKEPIDRIIDVLGWADRFREKFDTWLVSFPPSEERENLQHLLKEVGIEIQAVSNHSTLNPPGDLDCLFSAYLQKSASLGLQSRAAQEIRKMLKLSDDDLLYMATKGSALWSLQANARQHEKVLEYCKEEVASRQDKSTFELTIVVNLASRAAQNKPIDESP